jgi:hypothetical protein
MNCRECREKLEGLLESQGLPAKLTDTEMQKHISGCPSCSKEYRAITALKKGYAANERTTPPADFNEGVWEKIGQPAPSLFEKIFGTAFTPGFALQAAATAAAFVFLVIMAQKTFVKNEVVNKTVAKAVKTEKQMAVKPVVQSPGVAGKKPLNVPAPVEMARVQATPQPTAGQYIEPVKVAKAGEGPGKGPEKSSKQGNVYMANPATQPPVTSSGSQAGPGVSEAGINKNPGFLQKLSKPVVIESNVFNPGQGGALHIKYEVGKSAPVTIIVYNLKGEPVAQLVKAQKEAGVYEETWAGYDDNKTPLPSGKYIIYIKTDLTEQKVKAAIVK